jgi:hypothetical protein
MIETQELVTEAVTDKKQMKLRYSEAFYSVQGEGAYRRKCYTFDNNWITIKHIIGKNMKSYFRNLPQNG